MHKQLLASLFFILLPMLSNAQSAMEIISEGQILSSASLTDFKVPEYGAPTPNDLRIHELYVLHDNRLFLCHLTAARGNKTYPQATCFGEK